jgi:RimJ/RimL family protein N-acetyltransferase
MGLLRYPAPDLVDGPTRLRRWALDDIACIEEASTDTRIPEGTTVPVVFTAAEGRAFIARQWTRAESGVGISLAIASSESNTALGLVVLTLRPQQGVAGVGYWVVPSARQRGHASRAVRLFSDWALLDMGLARIEAWVEPGNVASQRVLALTGFVLEGTLRSFLSFRMRRADAMVFSRIAAP